MGMSMSAQTPEQTEHTEVRRLPKWTVRANLRRTEKTVWIGKSIEFFDDETEADKCYSRHVEAGDTPTKRRFHRIDEQDLHIMDSRSQASA